MFKIDKKTKEMKLTRGDVANFSVTAKNNDDDSDYIFQENDVVVFKVFKKRECNCVVLQKEVVVTEPTTEVNFILNKDDTKFDEKLNNIAVEYWYEVELNPNTEPQTIIGYDDSPTVFILLPEGGTKNE